MNPNSAILPMSQLTSRTPHASCIVGRVTQVWPLGHFIQANKTKAYQNFVLKDNSDSVMVTLFGNLAAEATHFLHENAVIRIQNFATKAARGRAGWHVTSLFENGRLRTEVMEERDPDLRNSFSVTRRSSIMDCRSYAHDTHADLIVIVSTVGNMETWTPEDGRPQQKFREISAFDCSAAEAKFTLWGRMAENFLSPVGTILAFRNAKVKKFQGTTKLTVGRGSNLHVSPNNDAALMLREWDDLRDQDVPLLNISEVAEAGTKFNSIKEIIDAPAPPVGRVQLTVRVMRVSGGPQDYFKHFYQACPKLSCTYKVNKASEKYFCPHCKKSYSDFSYCMRLWVGFADSAATFEASLFQRHLESVLPISMNSMYYMATYDKRFYESVLTRYLFGKEFTTTVIITQEPDLKLKWDIQDFAETPTSQNRPIQAIAGSSMTQ